MLTSYNPRTMLHVCRWALSLCDCCGSLGRFSQFLRGFVVIALWNFLFDVGGLWYSGASFRSNCLTCVTAWQKFWFLLLIVLVAFLEIQSILAVFCCFGGLLHWQKTYGVTLTLSFLSVVVLEPLLLISVGILLVSMMCLQRVDPDAECTVVLNDFTALLHYCSHCIIDLSKVIKYRPASDAAWDKAS